MTKEELLKNVYDTMIEKLVSKLEDKKYERDLRDNYMNYLEYFYGDLFDKYDNKEIFLKSVLDLQESQLLNTSSNYILSCVVPDEAFDRIKDKFTVVKERFENSDFFKNDEEVLKIVNELNNDFELVKDFNIYLASDIYNKAITMYKRLSFAEIPVSYRAK